jgi:hypothetical protein
MGNADVYSFEVNGWFIRSNDDQKLKSYLISKSMLHFDTNVKLTIFKSCRMTTQWSESQRYSLKPQCLWQLQTRSSTPEQKGNTTRRRRYKPAHFVHACLGLHVCKNEQHWKTEKRLLSDLWHSWSREGSKHWNVSRNLKPAKKMNHRWVI